ncbi:MAG: DUF4142 domain-containing protein [Phycisphaerales bacterium]|nr:DUF4142 domain-containing protein [Phycisphaerales bacterium]
MRRTAFSIVLAAEMFVLTGVAGAQTHAPAQPSTPSRPGMPERSMDPADRDRMQKEWSDMKKEWEALSPEARVLSIIHCKNVEEIELGRMAQEKGTAPSVKEYAAMMVRDHTDADTRLTSLTTSEKITVWDTARTDRALKLKKMFEKRKKDKDDGDKKRHAEDPADHGHGAAAQPGMGGQPGTPSTPASPATPAMPGRGKDDLTHAQMDPNRKPADVLRGMSGADFDAAYTHLMHKGHAELLEVLDAKDEKLTNANVKTYVNDVSATVRKHRDEAARMDGGTGDKDRGRSPRDPATAPKDPAVKDPHWDR